MPEVYSQLADIDVYLGVWVCAHRIKGEKMVKLWSFFVKLSCIQGKHNDCSHSSNSGPL